MSDSLLCFIDLETTGHDPLKLIEFSSGNRCLIPWHEIIDVGAVFAKSDSLEVVGEFQTLVCPEHPERCLPNLINDYPERAKTGEWDNAPFLEEAIFDLLCACEFYGNGEVVVPGGQNWFFDWSFLVTAFTWCGVVDAEWSRYLHYKRFDTASMGIQALRKSGETLDMSDYSLRSGKLQNALGIDPEPTPHRAINGARQALSVFRKLEEMK